MDVKQPATTVSSHDRSGDQEGVCAQGLLHPCHPAPHHRGHRRGHDLRLLLPWRPQLPNQVWQRVHLQFFPQLSIVHPDNHPSLLPLLAQELIPRQLLAAVGIHGEHLIHGCESMCHLLQRGIWHADPFGICDHSSYLPGANDVHDDLPGGLGFHGAVSVRWDVPANVLEFDHVTGLRVWRRVQFGLVFGIRNCWHDLVQRFHHL
mmetsp:Transcript_10727/g.24677  ORF Transcript_10727/g.24677 Transcript_10727/m.24677 type:complete len:205 (+) Transcript_10727:286-900(+)